MIVFLDIGSTLIDGPAAGPGKRIATELALGPEVVAAINEIIFKTDASTSSDLAACLSTRLGIRESVAAAAVKRIWDAQFAESFVLPGAVDAIESLRAAGFQRVYVSNIWRPFYLRFASEFPSEAGAQPCFPSFRTHRMKPDTGLLTCICRELGARAQDVIMVGDTWAADMAPAIESGMATIWILHRPAKEKDDLMRILNGAAAAPDLTLGSIGVLTPETVRRAHEIHMRRRGDN